MRYAVVRDTAMYNAVPFDPARPGSGRARAEDSTRTHRLHPESPPSRR
ncbi:hypothetical protein [Streptomyces sp. NPDC005485]